MSSFSISLTGSSSILRASFFPEIALDPNFEYSCGMLDFTTYHSMPNVTSKTNRLCYIHREENGGNSSISQKFLRIPVGSYEIDELIEYIRAEFHKIGIIFKCVINKNTLRSSIKCSVDIVRRATTHSILDIFGFDKPTKIIANTYTESPNIIKISRLNVIRIECDIVSGAYINGKHCHTIYEFPSQKVDVGYKIIEQPKHVIYLPISRRRIESIEVRVVDQDGDLIDLRGEEITCRIHIKRVPK